MLFRQNQKSGCKHKYILNLIVSIFSNIKTIIQNLPKLNKVFSYKGANVQLQNHKSFYYKNTCKASPCFSTRKCI